MRERLEFILTWAIAVGCLLAVAAVICVGTGVMGHLVYGNWRCGFAECRVLVEAK